MIKIYKNNRGRARNMTQNNAEKRFILVRLWLAWEGLMGAMITNIHELLRNARKNTKEPTNSPLVTEAVTSGAWGGSMEYLKQAVLGRKIMVISIITLIIVIPIAYLTLRYGGKIEAAWYDDNFAYRQRVDTYSSSSFTGRTSGFFVEGNIHQRYSNNQKSANNQKTRINIKQNGWIHNSDNSSNLTANIKKTIAKIVSYVNIQNLAGELVGKKLGRMTITAMAAADRLVNNPDKTLSQDLEKNCFIELTLTDKNFLVNKT